MNRNLCDPRQLDLFLREQLPADAHSELEAHISICPACRGRLDDMAGGSPWWSEVRKHLGGDGTSEMSRLSGPVSPVRNSSVTLYFLQPSDRSASLGRLGSYEVLEVLGRGGFGIVLKAFDPALHRPVAIKVLAPEFAVSVAARKRFAREAKAAAAVSHDHVVPVHAVDADATPPYLVMSLILGQSLQQRLDANGPLKLEEILRIGTQTAAGLAAAHAQGLVHRDIKPANIMLENGLERVRITDFGLARAVDDASISQSGALAGTPQYMSPEQATCEPVDQRSDLFALGSTLYAMCTGLAPFRGSPCLAVLKQVCESEPQSIRELNPSIPEWLEGIIRKLHAKNPAKHFESATEVSELLEQCLAHVQQPGRHSLPAVAAELGRSERIPTNRLRKHWPWLAAVLLVGVLSIGASFLANQPNTKEQDDVTWFAVPPPTEAVDVQPSPEVNWEALEQLRVRADQLQKNLRRHMPIDLDSMAAQIAIIRERLQELQHDESMPRFNFWPIEEGENR